MNKSHRLSAWSAVLMMLGPLTFADAGTKDIVPWLESLQPLAVGSQLVVMLRNDLGDNGLRLPDATRTGNLSLKTGVDLVWKGSTRTNAQVYALPLGTTREVAQRVVERLSLDKDVLWADLESKTIKPRLDAIESKASPDEGNLSRLIIKIRGDDLSDSLSQSVLGKLITAAGINLTVSGKTGFARILTLDNPIAVSELSRIERVLELLPEVTYVDLDLHATLQGAFAVTPNDPLFWRNWHLQDPAPLTTGSTTGLWGAANIQPAWQLTKGRSSIAVAVLDTGILFKHPDLKHALGYQSEKRGWDMISDPVMARDGNARDPDATDEGNWIDAGTPCIDKAPLSDSVWHGTHVAGIIAATTNNGVGISGVNWALKIVPVRVSGACGGSTSDIVDGVLWSSGARNVPGTAANKTPVHVINMSLTLGGSCPDSLQEAIDFALSKGIVVVAAAGNWNQEVGKNDGYPANCHGVISVASVNHLGDRAIYSNYGSDITIAAPGGQMFHWPVYRKNGSEIGKITLNDWGVWSTYNTSKTSPDLGEMNYAPGEGTSMATPVVAGVVSLMLSVDKKHKLTPYLVKRILRDTARPFPNKVPILIATTENIQAASQDSTERKDGLGASECTTTRSGLCGSGIVNAEVAVRKVIGLQ